MFTSDSQHPPRSRHAVYLGDPVVCSNYNMDMCDPDQLEMRNGLVVVLDLWSNFEKILEAPYVPYALTYAYQQKQKKIPYWLLIHFNIILNVPAHLALDMSSSFNNNSNSMFLSLFGDFDWSLQNPIHFYTSIKTHG